MEQFQAREHSIRLVNERVPKPLHAFLARYVRYYTHVYEAQTVAYALLVTERYPSLVGAPTA